jgi:hypothetical protein
VLAVRVCDPGGNRRAHILKERVDHLLVLLRLNLIGEVEERHPQRTFHRTADILRAASTVAERGVFALLSALVFQTIVKPSGLTGKRGAFRGICLADVIDLRIALHHPVKRSVTQFIMLTYIHFGLPFVLFC